MREKVKAERKVEYVAYFQTFEKILKSGQAGGKDKVEKTFNLSNAPIDGPLSIFDVFFQNYL